MTSEENIEDETHSEEFLNNNRNIFSLLYDILFYVSRILFHDFTGPECHNVSSKHGVPVL